ncbi:UNVERIFIED_CONTAM: hypothetical protein Sradi_1308100 [Sesamum radiatum]|uniref:Uncharacterized protein n=1 Tax=Sesamum radiatum TaxID=300843 RepID=A0AAW2UUA4_SESRA
MDGWGASLSSFPGEDPSPLSQGRIPLFHPPYFTSFTCIIPFVCLASLVSLIYLIRLLICLTSLIPHIFLIYLTTGSRSRLPQTPPPATKEDRRIRTRPP